MSYETHVDDHIASQEESKCVDVGVGEKRDLVFFLSLYNIEG